MESNTRKVSNFQQSSTDPLPSSDEYQLYFRVSGAASLDNIIYSRSFFGFVFLNFFFLFGILKHSSIIFLSERKSTLLLSLSKCNSSRSLKKKNKKDRKKEIVCHMLVVFIRPQG